MNERIARAMEQAYRDAEGMSAPPSSGGQITRRVAVGDPQAPLETFLTVLDQHRLLGGDGRLADGVQLVSIGDHFDYGSVAEREQATRDGLALLSWLSAHPAERVVLLVGNHDLSRVCELSHFEDDAAFARARAEADGVYRADPASPAAEAAFRARHPQLAASESIARDLSTFSVAQRRKVAQLLEARRLRVAHAAAPDLLLVHGAVTVDDLAKLGVSAERQAAAPEVARTLNGYLDRCVETWDGREPLDLEPLHRPQRAGEEGRGIFFQRPAHPAKASPEELEGPPRRRFDPRRLPRGLTQAVGHIRDDKCRKLLGPWVEDETPEHEGNLRTLLTDGQGVRYRAELLAVPTAQAGLVFLDGGMRSARPERYQLFDLDRRVAVGGVLPSAIRP